MERYIACVVTGSVPLVQFEKSLQNEPITHFILGFLTNKSNRCAIYHLNSFSLCCEKSSTLTPWSTPST